MDQNTTKKPRFPRIRSDFHMHSYHSGDSDTPMEDQIRAALSLGLSSVCWACPPSVLRNTWIWTGLIRIRRTWLRIPLTWI